MNKIIIVLLILLPFLSIGQDHESTSIKSPESEKKEVKNSSFGINFKYSPFRGLMAELYYDKKLSKHNSLHLAASSDLTFNHEFIVGWRRSLLDYKGLKLSSGLDLSYRIANPQYPGNYSSTSFSLNIPLNLKYSINKDIDFNMELNFWGRTLSKSRNNYWGNPSPSIKLGAGYRF